MEKEEREEKMIRSREECGVGEKEITVGDDNNKTLVQDGASQKGDDSREQEERERAPPERYLF